MIPHYREPLYNELGKHHKVTVLHSGERVSKNGDHYGEVVAPKYKLGPFIFQKNVLKIIREGEFDVVIAMFDIHWIYNIIAYYLYRKKLKFVWWGIVKSSNQLGNKIRARLLKNKANVIFYTKDGLDYFRNMGLDATNFQFCNNSVEIKERIKAYEHDIKDSLLFVGSLNARKQNDVLIKAFYNVKDKIPEEVKLNIVGAGVEEEILKELVSKLNLNERVVFHGAINDTSILQNFYKRAICSISFGQAGLSVLQSLGYGVPFVTKSNAISGGETSNIHHLNNGILCEDFMGSLEEYITKFCNSIDWSRELGKNGYNYFTDYCTMDHMVGKFRTMIEN